MKKYTIRSLSVSFEKCFKNGTSHWTPNIHFDRDRATPIICVIAGEYIRVQNIKLYDRFNSKEAR